MNNKTLLNGWLKETIELTARKKGLLEEIVQLTSSHAKLLGSGQAQDLLSLVKQRQRYIDDIIVIDSMLSQVETKVLDACGIRSWPVGKTVYNSDWQKILGLRRDIQALLQEVQSLDERNRRIISKECKVLNKKLQFLRVRRKTINAYQWSAAQPDGYFIDHKK